MQPGTQTDNRTLIANLASRFPVLESAPGIKEWDSQKLDEWAATVASTGERHAAAFVLHVWNCYHDWNVGRFDVMEALRTWDRENAAPFLEWAKDPYWF